MEKKERIKLKRLNSVLKKNTMKIVTMLFLFILCGYFYSYNMVIPKYKSTSTILLASNNLNNESNSVTQTEVTLNTNLISTYGKILKSNNVLGKVISNLNLEMTEEELYKNIKIEEIEDTQIIQIGVINTDAVEAQKIAEELNKVFIEEIKQIYKMDNINIVDKASLESEPYNINHLRDIFIFFSVGIIFSAIMISVIFIFDTTIKIEQDIEEFVGLSVIGAIPKNKGKNNQELVVQSNSKSIISEALKTIRTNISFSQINDEPKSILFTSCNSGEGKSWLASNMAVAYAQSNKNVIIVDADMRKGRQDKIFNVDNARGLSGCLREIKDENDFKTLEKYIKETEVPKVHIITIGAIPPNPSELLLSGKMEELINMLKCVYDVVIIDGTPCNLVSDSIPVSRIVDTTILVTESRKTKIEDLRNVVKSIKNAQGNIIGAVLNKKETKGKEYKKGYYYGKIDNNTKIEIKSYTAKELIKNRKAYVKEENIKEIDNNQISQISVLGEKLEELENKLLKIPDMNLESYTKIVEDVRKIYQKEIDKNKLAEDIKENIIKNELVKKLEENNIETKKVLEEKIEQLNYEAEIEDLFNQIANIENAINQNETEDKIINMIYEMQEEQNKKIAELDSSKFLNKILGKMEDIREQQEQSVEESNIEIKELLKEQIEQLNYEEEIKLLSDKLSNIENAVINHNLEQKIINIISEIKEEQEKKSKLLDNSLVLNNIVVEMQKLNRKYEKVDAIEKAIINVAPEEKINQMLEKLRKENERKLEKINSTEQVKEIMKELKKINNRYDKLAEKVSKNLEIQKTQQVKQTKKTSAAKNKVIELEEVKNKMKQEELIVEYGGEIAYEQLLDLAVEVYEINKGETSLKRRVE